MLNYVNEDNDILNAIKMKSALESHGGIRNTYISVVDLLAEPQTPVLSGQLKSFQILQHNNFIFQDDGMMAYKAYGLGGKLISTEDMTRISEKLLLKDDNLVFSGVKQSDPKPTTIQGVKQQDNIQTASKYLGKRTNLSNTFLLVSMPMMISS